MTTECTKHAFGEICPRCGGIRCRLCKKPMSGQFPTVEQPPLCSCGSMEDVVDIMKKLK